MKETKHIVFQTGRHYGGEELPEKWRGQVIVAEILSLDEIAKVGDFEMDRILRFYDISRGLRGEFHLLSDTDLNEYAMQDLIMLHYDANTFDSQFSGDEPGWEIEERMKKLAETFDNTKYLEAYARQVEQGGNNE